MLWLRLLGKGWQRRQEHHGSYEKSAHGFLRVWLTGNPVFDDRFRPGLADRSSGTRFLTIAGCADPKRPHKVSHSDLLTSITQGRRAAPSTSAICADDPVYKS